MKCRYATKHLFAKGICGFALAVYRFFHLLVDLMLYSMFTIAAFKSLIVLIGNCLSGILLPGRTYLHKLGYPASTPRFGLDFYHS